MKADEKFFKMAADAATNSYSDEYCILYTYGNISRGYKTKLNRMIYNARWMTVPEYIEFISHGSLCEYDHIWNKNRNQMPREISYYSELYAKTHGGTLDAEAGRNSYAVAWIYLLFKSFIPGVIISIISWYIFNGGWIISVLFGAWCIFAIVNSLIAENKKNKDLLHLTTEFEFTNFERNNFDGQYDTRLLKLVYEYVDCERVYEGYNEIREWGK